MSMGSEEKCSALNGKYELGRLLGHGTFAKVYHARNLQTGRSVAMKVVGKEKVLRVGMMEQVKREISVMKMMKHPNIVELHEVMASKTKIYFSMELVRGGELFAKIAKGKLREDAARSYFQQLISAIDFCHSRGVCHRDLKPENLLLDEEGNLKVTDFGLSTFSDHLRQDGLLHTTCGTPAYVAPEVIGKKGYDGAKADIWSCGVILFVLLAGYLPFQDDNIVSMYRKIYKGDFKCPPWFSPEARKLIAKMLDPRPSTRISIAKIMESSWFRKSIPKSLRTNEEQAEDEDNVEKGKETETMNAFHIISLSEGFNLSGLFEEKKKVEKEELRFATTKPAGSVISKLEEVAKMGNFSIKKSDSSVRLQGQERGRKGKLGIAADIFSVTPSFLVVEVKKSSGDTLEYNQFCCNELKPALKDIVWTSPTGSSVPTLSSGC
ncbi:CBL-interacting serine/threonine-protein kinase 6-like [Olea europaea var. sylvestris]|uniref:non-specific serine/threonine protein kinase n=1 Tax=Olea europaea subsp. europaea TaxID=158383 RepID=A0A8S0V320_OLEEU|nr:CBL-interacting serine/threonine-protein kinase 6-like [Olea europaea var. sylvestris]CAA3025442.1 CBL-interacting serine threonine- kinase 6-like [Olea europaea subsp. europaea]